MIFSAIALLVVALAFVAAELFVPSHGLLAIFALLAAITGVVMAFKVGMGLGLIFMVVIVIATPAVFYYAIKLYPTTAVGKRVLLDQPGASAGFEDQSSKLSELVGQQGTALTTLRPAGSIEVAGRRIDALSEADVIEAGTRIEVARVSGLKVFVKAATIN